jgi:hypothetical protein
LRRPWARTEVRWLTSWPLFKPAGRLGFSSVSIASFA